MESFFEGLVVVELADRRNQFAGKLLADGGARVIQVEPLEGSPGRSVGPFQGDVADPNRSLDYWWHNTSKESVALDVERGHGLVKQLVGRADIFLESAMSHELAPLGLSYASLRAGNERLIQASLTDFGQDGPWRDYAANDISQLALGGPMASSGYSDPHETPIGGQGHQAWNIAGTLCLHAILAALVERLTSGHGQYIDCAIHDCVSICTENAMPSWIFDAQALYRHTGRHATPARGGAWNFRAADGRWVNTLGPALSHPHVWHNLLMWMEELGVAGELGQPQWFDVAYRAPRVYGPEITKAIGEVIASVPAMEGILRAQGFGLTWSLIQGPEENLELKHWRDRGFFVPIEHEGVPSPVPYPRGPFAVDGVRWEPRSAAPAIGQHTRTVCQELLGLAVDEVRELEADGVVRCQ
jgi:crotonobetainyl-CoA:carnitine CoA-transferase CaiB-like acyl-CoA transferase